MKGKKKVGYLSDHREHLGQVKTIYPDELNSLHMIVFPNTL